MWIARELGRLLVRIGVTVGIALGFAVVLAAVGAGGFHGDARALGIAFGCMLLAMGAIGRGSNVERYADASITKRAWGVVPGFDALAALSTRPGDPQLAPGAALFLSGVVLIGLGVTVL